MKDITIAILAKDKGYCLHFYLHCLLQQTYPKDKILLYIRTNDNVDDTQGILENFIDQHGDKYKEVYYDCSSINKNLLSYKNHQWDSFRFNILGKIRQDSIDFAKARNTDYFVADCDNFLEKGVLKRLWDIRSFGVVGPLLFTTDRRYRGYSNMHNKSCPQGYCLPNEEYKELVDYPRKGFYEVSTVHCTYLVRNDLLDKVTYNDGSMRYEYAIFSDHLRRQNVPQLIDDREFNGFLFIDSEDHFGVPFQQFIQEHWLDQYLEMSKNSS
jgi:hypothetical protein